MKVLPPRKNLSLTVAYTSFPLQHKSNHDSPFFHPPSPLYSFVFQASLSPRVIENQRQANISLAGEYK